MHMIKNNIEEIKMKRALCMLLLVVFATWCLPAYAGNNTRGTGSQVGQMPATNSQRAPNNGVPPYQSAMNAQEELDAEDAKEEADHQTNLQDDDEKNQKEQKKLDETEQEEEAEYDTGGKTAGGGTTFEDMIESGFAGGSIGGYGDDILPDWMTS